jgi:hypothetical protein
MQARPKIKHGKTDDAAWNANLPRRTGRVRFAKAVHERSSSPESASMGAAARIYGTISFFRDFTFPA